MLQPFSHGCATPVVLNRGDVKKFLGGANPYMLYNIEKFWTGMCPF